MATDAREPASNLPIPHVDNTIAEDLARMITTITQVGSALQSLSALLSGTAPLSHTHTTGHVVGLDAELAGKAAANHSHTLDQLTDVDTSGAADGQVLTKVGANWVPGTPDYTNLPGLVTALNAKQPIDATLTALAALTTAADRLIYATGVDTFTVTPLTNFARSLLDDVDQAAARATLGLSVTTVTQVSASGTTPPGSPAVGERWLIAGTLSPTGAWAGREGQIATWDGTAWTFEATTLGQVVSDRSTLWTRVAGLARNMTSIRAFPEGISVTGTATAGTFAATASAFSPLLSINGATVSSSQRLAAKTSIVDFEHDGSGVTLNLDRGSAGNPGNVQFHTGATINAIFGMTALEEFVLRSGSAGNPTGFSMTLSTGLISFVNGINVGGGQSVLGIYSGTAALNFPSIAAGATTSLTMTVAGAVAGEACFLGIPASFNAGLNVRWAVTAANTVTIWVHNSTAAAIDPASATFRAVVMSF